MIATYNVRVSVDVEITPGTEFRTEDSLEAAVTKLFAIEIVSRQGGGGVCETKFVGPPRVTARFVNFRAKGDG